MAVSTTQLFVCNVSNPTGSVDVYTLPLTNSSAPAFTITTGVNGAEGCALDASGNLYVANINNTTVTVYAPPFSAASAPTVTLAGFAGFQLTVGP
jgi:sugar lactone lactonase YvrE